MKFKIQPMLIAFSALFFTGIVSAQSMGGGGMSGGGMGGGGGGSEVPVVEHNSGDVLSSTKKIENQTKKIETYTGDVRKFLGADVQPFQRDPKDGKKQLKQDIGDDFKSLEFYAKKVIKDPYLDSQAIEGMNDAINKYFGADWNSSEICNKLVGVNIGSATAEEAEKKPYPMADNQSAEKNLYHACHSARNMLALNLLELNRLLTTLDERAVQLNNLLEKDYKNSGELQIKQYELSALQTIIQNDMLRLQVSLAAYAAKKDYYQQVHAEAQKVITYGKNQAHTSARATVTSVLQNVAITGVSGFLVSSPAFDSLLAGVARAHGLIRNTALHQ